jgi:hypothetical protein
MPVALLLRMRKRESSCRVSRSQDVYFLGGALIDRPDFRARRAEGRRAEANSVWVSRVYSLSPREREEWRVVYKYKRRVKKKK